ncbi:MAG: glycosyltransferase family 2 protein [Terriglobales bacterium]
MELPLVPGPLSARLPLVSILTPNYNYARFLPRAVASVRAQTYQDWEMIICDDCSTDDSRDVIRETAASEPRVRPVLLERNRGVAGALNACFAASVGDIICLLDADDTWAPEKIELVVAVARRVPSAGLLVHPLLHIDKKRRPIRVYPPGPLASGWYGPEMAEFGAGPNLPPASGLSLRRLVAGAVFPLPESFRTLADAAIIWVAAALTRAEVVSQSPLGTLLIHGSNVTSAQGALENFKDGGLLESWQRLARDVSGLAGPWPCPWLAVLSALIPRRISGEIRWSDWRRELRDSASWRHARGKNPKFRLFFEVVPVLPPVLFGLLFRLACYCSDLWKRKAVLLRRLPRSKANEGLARCPSFAEGDATGVGARD